MTSADFFTVPSTMQGSSPSSSIEMDTKLSDLLCPIRDPTKNWEVNIAETLEEYLSKLEGLHVTFHNGCISLNFAQAALIIQGSTSVYCKKVEYLCNLCQQMLHIISSERRIQQPTGSEACKEKDINHPSSASDDFCSLDDLKIQKGLELIEDEHNHSKKRTTLPFTPVMLIRLEEREKGNIFLLNFKGEVIGNKRDFNLNICDVDDSGALCFPVSFSEKSAARSASPDFSNIPPELDDSSDSDAAADADVVDNAPLADAVDNAPLADAVDNAPLADAVAESHSPPHSNSDVPMVQENLGTPIKKQKRILDVPVERDILDVSTTMEKDNSGIDMGKDASKCRRKSARQGDLKAKLAAAEKKKLDSAKKHTSEKPKVEQTPKRKAARKLSSKLDTSTIERKSIGRGTTAPPTVDPIEGFCCQSFYSAQRKCPSIILKTPTIDILHDIFWEGSQKKSAKPNEPVEEMDMPHENCEGDDGTKSSDDDNGCSFPEAEDRADDSPRMSQQDDNADVLQPCSSAEANKDNSPENPAFEELTNKSVENYLSSIAHYCRTDDLTKKVNEWEERVKPILKTESDREAFDIHVYETNVMKNFEDTNRKQTVSFSKICKGKQKWEICRYFVASLQLANSYHIDISTDNPEEENSIDLTLLSRKTQ